MHTKFDKADQRALAPVILSDVRREEALRISGTLQKAIFDSVNFSSIATDAKGIIQVFNVGAGRMLGYTAAEVMNKLTPADISDPEEVIARAKALSAELDTPITPGFEALVFKARRGIEDIYELTYIRKDGSRFPAVVSVTALRDEQDAIIGYLLIGTDNTARKQAEEALLKAGALQKAIFDSANFSSIATDAKGVIQIFNVGAERMLGYAAVEVMNKITPADISDPQEVIARAAALSLELGTPIKPGFEALVFKASRGIEDIYELTYLRKNGSRFPAVVSVTALRDAQNTIIGYLLIGTDNTARKAAAQLLDAVNEEMRQFVSIASHDLRQPLRMVTSYLGLIEKRLAPQSLTDEIKEFLGFAVSGAKRMDSLILGLLEYSRTGTSCAMVAVPLAEAVADALSNLVVTIREAGAEIVVAEGLPTVVGDMMELTRLFQNLIGNAVKYHGPERSPKIEIGWSRKGNEWLIRIKDNGIGIAPEDRERAFGIFQRLVPQDAYEGTGIGLAVCKKVVEHHGGRIWIEPALGEGTTFLFTLRDGSAAT